MRARTKSYNGKINTNFHNNKMSKKDSQFIYLLVILIDPVFRAGKNCYPQVFLQECKYIIKEKLISNYIFDDENSDEKILIMKILVKKIKYYLKQKVTIKEFLKQKVTKRNYLVFSRF